MHMYCAPITAVESETQAPTDDEIQMRETDLLDRDDLPEMFWGSANFSEDTCYPPDDKAIAYPNPGKSVDRRVDDSKLAPPSQCPSHLEESE